MSLILRGFVQLTAKPFMYNWSFMRYYCIGSSEFVKFIRIDVNCSQSISVWFYDQILKYTPALHYPLSHPEVIGHFHKICVYLVRRISPRGTRTLIFYYMG